MVSPTLLLMTSFLKLIIFNACSIKDSKKLFMQFLSLYTSRLFSMLLNDDIAGIETYEVICSPAFAENELSGLFLHQSVFFIKHSRFA